MLKKLLNPFGIKITNASKGFVIMGLIASILLHISFYYAIFHFVRKVW
jgi:hypothetical protein